MPFAAAIAGATLIGLFVTRDRIHFPATPVTITLALFAGWMTVTFLFALEPEQAYPRWKEVMKVIAFIFVTMLALHDRKHIKWLLWVIVISVGYYGVKGGLFTIVTGGGSKVYGPPGDTYISDNNAIAVALVMVIPLMYYLAITSTSRLLKIGLMLSMVLSGAAVLGSQSRGAFLAIIAGCAFLWLHSRKKLFVGALVVVALPFAIVMMPDSWKNRMRTIETYEADSSSMGRINAWKMAINLANDRPLVGGGFEMYSRNTFDRYAPDPEDVHAAHSIYFQILGEHGYVGLGLFLLILIFAWRTATKLIEKSHERPDWEWAGEMARAVQVSLVGFFVGGAFINIAYWDLQYYEIALLVIATRLLGEEAGQPVAQTAVTGQPRQSGVGSG
jgi:probable O-glycosylation ligase (exosortase A-associated)